MNEDACDNCGQIRELYHNEAAGLAFCESCDTVYDAAHADDGEDEVEDTSFHAELRRVIEQAEGTGLEALVPQARALLALPEGSIALLVSAAQSMVGAASFNR